MEISEVNAGVHHMRPIAFYPQLAKILGDIESAIYYQQILYWADKGKRKDGFIYKTKEELEAETTLTRDQQDRVRKNLVKLGWLEVKNMRANGHNTLHYKPLKSLELIVSEGNPPRKSHRGKSTIPTVGNPLLEKRENHDLVTETTTEITTTTLKGSGKEPNPYVQELINHLKEKLGSNTLDGSQQINRRYAWLLLQKCRYRDGPDSAAEGAKRIINLAFRDRFHSGNATSMKYIYNNAVKIVATSKSTQNNIIGL